LAGLISSIGSMTTSTRGGWDCEGLAGICSPNQRRTSHASVTVKTASREWV
jgi:hypothetical protein